MQPRQIKIFIWMTCMTSNPFRKYLSDFYNRFLRSVANNAFELVKPVWISKYPISLNPLLIGANVSERSVTNNRNHTICSISTTATTKWILHVTGREINDILKKLAFHTTKKKMEINPNNSLNSVNSYSTWKLMFLRICFNTKILWISTDSSFILSVNEYQMFLNEETATIIIILIIITFDYT